MHIYFFGGGMWGLHLKAYGIPFILSGMVNDQIFSISKPVMSHFKPVLQLILQYCALCHCHSAF